MTAIILICLLFDDRLANLQALLNQPPQEQQSEAQPPVTPSEQPQSPAAPVPLTVTWEATTADVRPQLTLYTADGWKCVPCDEQKRILEASEEIFDVVTVPVRYSTDSPTGQVPVWKAADGTLLTGSHPISRLEQFAKEHSRVQQRATTATVNAAASAAIVAALLESHLSDQQAVSGLLDIDAHVSEDVLTIARQLLVDQKWSSGNVTLDWKGGDRSLKVSSTGIVLSPPARVSLSKWQVRASTDLEGISYDQSLTWITLQLRRSPDLTIRFQP